MLSVINLFLTSLVCSITFSIPINQAPIIGVVTNPSDSPQFRNPINWSYFEANYVQYLEFSGARIVPIPYDLPDSELEKLLNKVNGILFTGGSTLLWTTEIISNTRRFSKFTILAKRIYDFAIRANTKGDFFPVWGTCQGLELIVMLTANSCYVLDSYNQTDIPGTINPLPIMYRSKFFSEFSKTDLDDLARYEYVWFWHHWGLSLKTYHNVKTLENEFILLALGNDTQNKTFVAAMESRKFPIYVTQFHPERIAYDWFDSTTIPHEPEAIIIEQHMANFFVHQTRKNRHRFKDERDLEQFLVNKHPISIPPDTLVPTFYFFRNEENRTRVNVTLLT